MKRKIHILFLMGCFLSVFQMVGQSNKGYAKFKTPVVKLINASKVGATDIFVEFKSKKEATIYLELIREGKIMAGDTYTGISKKAQTIKMNLQRFNKNGLIVATNDYHLKITCFEGPKGKFKVKLGDNQIIKNVRLSRLQ